MASVRQRGKTFTGYWRDADGTQRTKGGFVTDTEALAHAIQEERRANPPATEIVYPETRRGKITIAGYGPGWLAAHDVEATTRQTYAHHLGRIIKGIGTEPVETLTAGTVRTFIGSLRGEVGERSRQAVLTVLRSMLDTAVADGLITGNPARYVKVRGVRARKMMIATPGQAKAIREAIQPRYALLAETLFATGMRWSELTALKAADIRDGRIVITRTIVEVGGKFQERSYGKTSHSLRSVSIPPGLEERLIANAGKDGYVFSAPRGGRLARSNFRRVWVPACVSAGVPGLRVHDCRHSHASWLANDPRVPLVIVRDRLGHGDLRITSRYVHMMDGGEDPCLAALEVAA